MESYQEKRAKTRRVLRTIEAMSQGASTPQEIEQNLLERERKMGEEAEKRAMDAVKELRMVREIREATTEEDQERKMDFVVSFENDNMHAPVGVQVKSSETGLKNFFKTLKPGERIIGINAGLGISDKYIQQNFLRQLGVLDSSKQGG